MFRDQKNSIGGFQRNRAHPRLTCTLEYLATNEIRNVEYSSYQITGKGSDWLNQDNQFGGVVHRCKFEGAACIIED